MSLLSLFKNSNNNNPNTLIWGSDIFLNEYLINSYLQEKKFKNLEHVIVDCESEGLDTLIADLTESSLFAQQKIVIVKNPFFLTTKVPKKLNKQINQLQKIFDHIKITQDVVVIEASYDKIDRRKKITKTVINNFNVVEPQVRSYETLATIKAIIKEENYDISQQALQLLVERSDAVIDVILSNYNKLKVIATDHRITEQAVKDNIDLSLAQNIFAILDSALKHQYGRAIERLNDQLKEGTNPIQLLAVFENQLEVLLVVNILGKRGRTQPQIVKELGIHPYRVKLALKSQLKIKQLKKLLLEAIELDYNYKNGNYRNDNFLKAYLLNV